MCIRDRFVSVHAGTEEGTETRVGSDCALLAHSHVAHNCQVGNHVVLSHSATLAGYVICDDYANLGGLSAVHQSCHVGRAAMVAGMSRVIQDVLPFTIAEGFPAHMRIVNSDHGIMLTALDVEQRFVPPQMQSNLIELTPVAL